MAVYLFRGFVPRLEWKDDYDQLKENWSLNCLYLNHNIVHPKQGSYSYKPYKLFCI